MQERGFSTSQVNMQMLMLSRQSEFAEGKRLSAADFDGVMVAHPIELCHKKPKHGDGSPRSLDSSPPSPKGHDDKDWYLKLVYDPEAPWPLPKNAAANRQGEWPLGDPENIIAAVYELIAQELERFMIPGISYPKTRLIYRKGKIYIASEAIENNHAQTCSAQRISRHDSREHVLTGKYSGLGNAIIMTLLVCNRDFKRGNIKLAGDNKDKGVFIAFDGGWSFAALYQPVFKDQQVDLNPERYKITAEVLANLPYPATYQTEHWPFALLTPEMVTNPKFRREVNEQIFKIILLPDALIEKFVRFYFDLALATLHDFLMQLKATQKTAGSKISAGTYNSVKQIIAALHPQPIINFLIARRNDFWAESLQNRCFLSYLRDSNSETEVKKFIESIRNFKTIHKKPLLNDSKSDAIEAGISAAYHLYRSVLDGIDAVDSLPDMLEYAYTLTRDEVEPVFTMLFTRNTPFFPTFSPNSKGGKFYARVIRDDISDKERYQRVWEFIRFNPAEALSYYLNKLLDRKQAALPCGNVFKLIS